MSNLRVQLILSIIVAGSQAVFDKLNSQGHEENQNKG